MPFIRLFLSVLQLDIPLLWSTDPAHIFALVVYAGAIIATTGRVRKIDALVWLDAVPVAKKTL